MTVMTPEVGEDIDGARAGLQMRIDHGGDHPVRLVHWAAGPDALSVVAPSAIVDVKS